MLLKTSVALIAVLALGLLLTASTAEAMAQPGDALGVFALAQDESDEDT